MPGDESEISAWTCLPHHQQLRSYLWGRSYKHLASHKLHAHLFVVSLFGWYYCVGFSIANFIREIATFGFLLETDRYRHVSRSMGSAGLLVLNSAAVPARRLLVRLLLLGRLSTLFRWQLKSPEQCDFHHSLAFLPDMPTRRQREGCLGSRVVS